jgi:hypothetical protein
MAKEKCPLSIEKNILKLLHATFQMRRNLLIVCAGEMRGTAEGRRHDTVRISR